MKHNIFFAACVVVVSLMAIGCSNNSGSDKKQTMVKAEKEDSIAAERLKMEQYHDSVCNAIAHKVRDVFEARLKGDSVDVLAKNVNYPININRYLLIKNENDFKRHYRLLFNDSVKRSICNSSEIEYINKDNLTRVDGHIDLMDNGFLYGYYYQTAGIAAFTNQRKAEDKARLHSSLRDFDMPVVYIETMNHKLRIDKCKDTFRLSVWPTGKMMSSKPDLTLLGDVYWDGHGGNHFFLFYSGNLVYEVYIVVREYESGVPAALFYCRHIKKESTDFFPNGEPDDFHAMFEEASVLCEPDFRLDGFREIRDEWR